MTRTGVCLLITLGLLASCGAPTPGGEGAGPSVARDAPLTAEAQALLEAVDAAWPAGSPASAPAPRQPRGEGSAEGRQVHGASLAPTLALSTEPARGSGGEASGLRVTLPEREDGVMRLEARGVAVGVRRLDGSPAVAQRQGAGAVYARGGGEGTVVRRLADGVEDHVRRVRPGGREPAVDYEIELGEGAAGLRQVGAWLEVVGADGVPRIRMDAPHVIDATGARLAAEVSVTGCPVDRSPASPAGRPASGRGAGACRLRVGWRGGEYPVVIDPAWRSTGSMAVLRIRHGAARLASGQVLIAGGSSTDVAELYIPPAEGDETGAGAIALTGALPEGNIQSGAMAATPGGAIYHGGDLYSGGNKASCWLYSAATGTWRAGPNFSPIVKKHQLVRLPDGRLLVAGGEEPGNESSSVTAIYDPSAGPDGSWTKRAPLPEPRRSHATVAVGNRVLVVGGRKGDDETATTRVYDVASDAWSEGPELGEARTHLTATLLSGQQVLVMGGALDDDHNSKQVDLLDLSTSPGTSKALAPMAAFRGEHEAVRLSDGRVLLVGGHGAIEDLPRSELYDPTGATASRLITQQPRTNHTLTWLGGLRALATGGENSTGQLASTDLFQLRVDGSVCGDGEQCGSGFCTDGVCCREACGGECEACTQKARGTAEPDGVCAARGDGVEPRLVPSPACQASPSKCGQDGLCNGQARSGAAACRYQAEGTLCSKDPCGPPLFAFSVCDGKGTCAPRTCSPFTACASDAACATACQEDAVGQCEAGTFCLGGACIKPQADGAACAADGQCGSGFCVDGVCCNEACGGTCRACSKEAKGQGEDGECGFVSPEVPSEKECAPQAAVSCGRTGACDGAGKCAQFDDTTTCQSNSCEQTDEGAAEYEFRCGEAACVPRVFKDCGLYPCAGGGCASSCAGDDGCTHGARCVGGQCEARRGNGAACAGGEECESGVCADGVCCNTTCDQQCEACNQPASPGTCVARRGPPLEGRAACPAGPDVCGQSVCDGVERGACKGLVGDDVACGQDACVDGRLQPAARCAGNGECVAPPAQSCAPYGCAGAGCRTSCAADADCAPGAQCEGERCVQTDSCQDATTLLRADGTRRDCAPFRCDGAGRACLERCASSADCAPGAVCTGAGACEPPRSADEPGEGCSLPATGAPAGGARAALLLAAAAALGRRLRRLGAAGALGALLGGCADAADRHAGGAGQGEAPGPSAGPDGVVPLPAGGERLGAVEGGELRAPEVTGYRAGAGGWRPALRERPEQARAGELRRRRPGGASVTLPARASGAAEVRDDRTGLSVRVRLEGASEAPARPTAAGLLRYEGALGPGTALWHLPSREGTEDHLALDAAAARRGAVSYEVELGEGVAGVRQVSGAVEFLDAGGAPRLRMAPPYARGERGGRVAVRTEVRGCAVSRDPRPPWGRPVAAAGAPRCEVRLSWEPDGGAMLLDPAWQATGEMAQGRLLQTATRLTSGQVLVAGTAETFAGNSVIGTRESAEVYDPTTGTWALTGSMNQKRAWHSAWLLPSGRVVVAAGIDGDDHPLNHSEIYDPATGLWTLTGGLTKKRYTQAAATLSDGRPFMAGGYTSSPDTFHLDALVFDEDADGGVGSWQTLPQTMTRSHRYAVAVNLPGKRVLVASGTTSLGSFEFPTTATDIFDEESGSWTAGPSMVVSHFLPTAAVTPTGVLFAGGFQLKGTELLPGGDVEFFRFSSGQFEARSPMEIRVGASGTWLPQLERVLVAGGALDSALSSAVLLATEPGVPSTDAGTMNAPHAFQTATVLASGAVLIAGGGTGALDEEIKPSKAVDLFSLAEIGDTCTQDGECPRADPADPLSQHCVDGVCCNEACGGTCRACSKARKGQGDSGTCGPIVAGVDPDQECPKEQESTCGFNGQCDGQGSCQRYADGTPCAQACAGAVAKAGVCAQGACHEETVSCGLHACNASGTACLSACASSAGCQPGAYCDQASQQCKPRLPVGSACAVNDACDSNYCTDGVCCVEACSTQPCRACRADLQDPGSSPESGQCRPARPDTNPRDLCAAEPCGTRAACDGQGQCQRDQAGDSCGDQQCVGNAAIGFRTSTFVCVDEGGQLGCKVNEAATQPCDERYACREGACLTQCTGDDDCTDRAYCKDGGCQPRLADGEACGSPSQCLSRSCVDGVCCHTPCDGSCGRCNQPGQQGRCVPVADPPTADRAPCPAAPDGEPCAERICDGITVATCEGRVGSAVQCRAPSCQGGTAVPVAYCDGQGACSELPERDCFPYGCDGAVCRTSCASDADCAGTNRCEAGVCVGQLTCDPERGTLRNSSGQVVKECDLYRCSVETGACLERCASSADCAPGVVCTGAGACEPPRTPADPEADGCGCRQAPARSTPAAPLALLAGLASLARRRRAPRP